MLLHVLQQIVKSIKANISCPHCKTRFRNKDFDVVDLLDGELYLEVECKKCNKVSLIAATITETHQGISFVKNQNQETPQKDKNPISETELKNLNSTLKTCSGGFKDLFKKK